jgi:hypothetical protein
MNSFLRKDDLSFIKYSSNYEKAENSSLGNLFESISLDYYYAWVCFNVSKHSLTLDELELKIFFGMYVGCMVRKVGVLSERFYRLDLKFTSILIYFRGMIVICR